MDDYILWIALFVITVIGIMIAYLLKEPFKLVCEESYKYYILEKPRS